MFIIYLNNARALRNWTGNQKIFLPVTARSPQRPLHINNDRNVANWTGAEIFFRIF
jgi:hypothetical protein